MSEQTPNTPAAETPAADGLNLSPAEQASIEAARRGLTEPENVNVPQPSAGERPDGVPEQFWKDGKVDVVGLAKSYAELRSKMDAPKAEPEAKPEDITPATDAEGKIKKPDEAAEQTDGEPTPLQQAMETARTEWADTQEVTEETVAALEAAGIPRDVFNLYLEGLKATSQQLVTTIHGYAGGKEGYEAATAWAAKNLSADEIAAFNDALDNPELRETAVVGLMARYQKAVPNEGRPLTPTDTPSVPSDVFTSRDELVAAQKDPRYQTDAKYRGEVVAKLARSQKAGFTAFKQPLFQREVFQR